MTELKPCPFCGGAGKYHGSYDEDDVCEYVSCTRCNASTPLMDKKGESIKWWNRRANPWHTGTPTEEGKYLCWVSFPDVCKGGEDSWKCKWLNGEWIDDQVSEKISLNTLGFKVIAWQKITPFEAGKENA